MNCVKVIWEKLWPSYRNEETLDKEQKLVKDIVATTHDLNLEVKEDDVKELYEIHNRKLNSDELKLKNFSISNVKQRKGKFHSKVMMGRKNILRLLKLINVWKNWMKFKMLLWN